MMMFPFFLALALPKMLFSIKKKKDKIKNTHCSKLDIIFTCQHCRG